MDELASHAVGAVASGHELLAELGLVEDRDICLDHHLGLLMGERALISVLAFAVQIPVFAHLGPEFVDVRSAGSEVVLDVDAVKAER
jgi:hypothetical protein